MLNATSLLLRYGNGNPPPPPAPQLVADFADLFCQFVGFLNFTDLFCQLPNCWNTYHRLTKHLWLVVCLEGHYIHTGVQPQWCTNWYISIQCLS